MKKRIILILTFLLTTMFLTGCTVETANERIKEVNEVANEVAKNGAGYKLPEGYDIKYLDTKDIEIIDIIYTGEEYTIYARYKIVNSTAQKIITIIDDHSDSLFIALFFACTVIAFLLGTIVGRILK